MAESSDDVDAEPSLEAFDIAPRFALNIVHERDINAARKMGMVSLVIKFDGDENIDMVKAEICDWAGQIKEGCKGLGLTDVNVKAKGRHGNRWMEMDLHESEGRGLEIKGFLIRKGYFQDTQSPHRVLFAHQQRQKQLVVMEGRIGDDAVRPITTFWRREDGHEFYDELDERCQFGTQKSAEDFYNRIFTRLLLQDADDSTLDTAITLEGRAWVDETTGQWVIGPGSKCSLSFWPRKKPFLLQAARMGCAKIVNRLVSHYRCSISTHDSHGGTPLHLSSYWGHAGVVCMLLELNADQTAKNKYGETALECAIQGRKEYREGKFEFPKFSSKQVIDFRRRSDWPRWVEAIEVLKKARIARCIRPDLGQIQKDCPQALIDLTEKCWNDNPDMRPLFRKEEILDRLDACDNCVYYQFFDNYERTWLFHGTAEFGFKEVNPDAVTLYGKGVNFRGDEEIIESEGGRGTPLPLAVPVLQNGHVQKFS